MELGSILSWMGRSCRKPDPWRVCGELRGAGERLRREATTRVGFRVKKRTMERLLKQADYYLFLAQAQGMLPDKDCERVRRRVRVTLDRLVQRWRRD